jgi:hypothetical protein
MLTHSPRISASSVKFKRAGLDGEGRHGHALDRHRRHSHGGTAVAVQAHRGAVKHRPLQQRA